MSMDIKSYLEQKEQQQQTKSNRPNFTNFYGGSDIKSAGQTFVESEAYKSFIANGRNSSDNVPVNTKALVTSLSAGGDLLSNMQVVGMGEQTLTLRDLLRTAPTDQNSVEYIKEVGFVNSAAIAPESTEKPESALSYEIEQARVSVIAHHIPATRQIIMDSPSIREHIDQRLIYGLKTTEEAQILYGNGTGDNLLGLMVNTEVQTYTPEVDDTAIDTLRKAINRTMLAGFPPSGIVLHPNDWMEIELLKGTDGRYLITNVHDGAQARLFRLPVVTSTAMAENSFLVGSFGLSAQLFDREQANVRVSEHHADFFIRNQLSILAEERLALATFRPEGFCRGTFTAAV